MKCWKVHKRMTRAFVSRWSPRIFVLDPGIPGVRSMVPDMSVLRKREVDTHLRSTCTFHCIIQARMLYKIPFSFAHIVPFGGPCEYLSDRVTNHKSKDVVSCLKWSFNTAIAPIPIWIHTFFMTENPESLQIVCKVRIFMQPAKESCQCRLYFKAIVCVTEKLIHICTAHAYAMNTIQAGILYKLEV